jgi:phosphoserine phosphatase
VTPAAVDPLPTWSEGWAKAAIIDFVARVTEPDGTDFVPVVERIATFDNDGTLWCEQPMQVQIYFALDRLAELARGDASLRHRQPFRAFLERDMDAIAALGRKAAFQFAFATHAGVTEEEFGAAAETWLATARHPTLGRLFTENVYAPQLELLDFLRANGFSIFIVSGGGIDFIRAFSQQRYGVRRESVIGSSVKTHFLLEKGRAAVLKLSEIECWNDREAKVTSIWRHVGRRPLLAFGNSDGDLAMLRYARSSAHPSLALLLHHDDADREFAYDRDFRLSPLSEALDQARDVGITVVSMKDDWRVVFRSDGDGYDAPHAGSARAHAVER